MINDKKNTDISHIKKNMRFRNNYNFDNTINVFMSNNFDNNKEIMKHIFPKINFIHFRDTDNMFITLKECKLIYSNNILKILDVELCNKNPIIFGKKYPMNDYKNIFIISALLQWNLWFYNETNIYPMLLSTRQFLKDNLDDNNIFKLPKKFKIEKIIFDRKRKIVEIKHIIEYIENKSEKRTMRVYKNIFHYFYFRYIYRIKYYKSIDIKKEKNFYMYFKNIK